jgi:predicted acylesterase/phospholipase RssA/CRP-like cAMP-binding protein
VSLTLDRSASGLMVAVRPGAQDGREPIASVLAKVPLFAAAGRDVIERMAERAETVRLEAGEWLFRTGDQADALYVVSSGRLEVLIDGSPASTLGRGDVIGELALLTSTPRSASARAQRDSELVRLAGDELAAVLRESVDASMALNRALSQQLQESRAREEATARLPGTIAILPLAPGLPLRPIRDGLLHELTAHERVVEFDGGGADDDAERARLLDALERDHDQILLVARDPDPADPWTAFCLRQADRVVALAGPGTRVPRALIEQLRGRCDLAHTGRPAPGLLDALEPQRRYLVADGAGVARMARRLSGRSVGVVLSGGGARGAAHLGVLEELVASGVEIDRVGGASMGALVGSLFAAGLSIDEIAARMTRELVERNPMNDFTIPLVALTRGRKGEAMVRRLMGELLVEDLERDFFSVSSDLIANEAVEHRSGPLAEAVGASISIPGFVPPVEIGERLLVDGGVLDNLPVARMPRDEGPVIAINVSASSAPPPPPSRWRRPRTRKMAATVRRVVTGVEAPRLGLAQSLMRSVVLGAQDATAAAGYADLLISPDVSGVDLLDWKAMPAMRGAGRAAAREALTGSLVRIA